jgi:hypothetical protein
VLPTAQHGKCCPHPPSAPGSVLGTAWALLAAALRERYPQILSIVLSQKQTLKPSKGPFGAQLTCLKPAGPRPAPGLELAHQIHFDLGKVPGLLCGAALMLWEEETVSWERRNPEKSTQSPPTNHHSQGTRIWAWTGVPQALMAPSGQL